MTSLGERTGTLFEMVARHGDRAALVWSAASMSHAELAARAVDQAATLGLVTGRLVAMEAAPTPSFVVSYLAAQAAGCPVLVLPTGADELVDRYRPQLVVRADATVEHHDPSGATVCHPELALALSTSGSTGAPRLVRLSHSNLVANATAIAEYLGLGPEDRAITNLPLHYCYGLSVLHSHLAAGAAVVLSGASVVDPCHWAAMERHGVTSLAAVPHTMELLERVGFDRMDLPRLRAVTVAGGRLEPDKVRHWAEVGRRRGWDLYVMYGQTEATARMAYLPPDLALDHPDSVGRAIPGGSFEIRPHPAADPGIGEVVYRGPNVMMGYADGPGDLAHGPELAELATGDLGRLDSDTGLLHLVGRARRFVKPLGVRVDLDQLERRLQASGIDALCGGDDMGVAVAATAPEPAVRRALADVLRLPPGAVHVATCDALPRLANGKPDHQRVLQLARTATDPQRTTASVTPQGVAEVVGSVLGGPIDPTCSFVELGGDSLSYVECSVRLGDLLGSLPADWHLIPLADLADLAAGTGSTPAGRGRRVEVDTTVVLRALAICAVVATHMHLWRIPGGAHLMLAVSGYNLSRFALSRPTVVDRLRSIGRVAAGVAIPTVAWIAINMAITGGYSRGSLFLVNNYFGSAWRTGGRWRYWYVEVLLQLLVAMAVVVAIPGIRRLHRRFGYALPLALLALCLVPRYGLVRWGDEYNLLYRTHWVAWFFVLGWLIHRSATVPQRWATTAVVVATIPGFFDRPQREWCIIAGLVALVWWRQVRLPRVVVPALAALAASSLWILLVHWQVWPALTTVMQREAAYVPTLAAGVGAWWVAERIRRGIPMVMAPVTRLGVGCRAGNPPRWRPVSRPVLSPLRRSAA